MMSMMLLCLTWVIVKISDAIQHQLGTVRGAQCVGICRAGDRKIADPGGSGVDPDTALHRPEIAAAGKIHILDVGDAVDRHLAHRGLVGVNQRQSAVGGAEDAVCRSGVSEGGICRIEVFSW